MKKSIFILLLSLCASFAARSQSYTIDSLDNKYKETKTTAITMAVLGPVTIGGGAVLVGLGVYSKQPAASLAYIVGGSFAVGAGLFETIYAFILADRADKQKEALIKLRSGASLIIDYPAPVLLGGAAPGVGFTMKF